MRLTKVFYEKERYQACSANLFGLPTGSPKCVRKTKSWSDRNRSMKEQGESLDNLAVYAGRFSSSLGCRLTLGYLYTWSGFFLLFSFRYSLECAPRGPQRPPLFALFFLCWHRRFFFLVSLGTTHLLEETTLISWPGRPHFFPRFFHSLIPRLWTRLYIRTQQ